MYVITCVKLLNKKVMILCHFVIRKKRQSETKTDSRIPVELDDLKNDSPDTSASTSNLVYQNVAELHRPAKGIIMSCIQVETKKRNFHQRNFRFTYLVGAL